MKNNNEKKGFLLYKDQKEVIDCLSIEEKAELLDAIFLYQNNKEVIVSKTVNLVWIPIRTQFERDGQSYEEFREKQSRNGKKGGRPKKPVVNKENPKKPVVNFDTQKSLKRREEKSREEKKRKEITTSEKISSFLNKNEERIFDVYLEKFEKNDIKPIIPSKLDYYIMAYNEYSDEDKDLFEEFIEDEDEVGFFEKYAADTQKKFRKNPESFLTDMHWKELSAPKKYWMYWNDKRFEGTKEEIIKNAEIPESSVKRGRLEWNEL